MGIIKVLHFFGKMDMGGAETFVMNLYRHINRNKIQFEFVVTNSEKGSYDNEIRRLGGKIHILPPPNIGLRNYKYKLKELLTKGEFDVVHSHVHYFSGINLNIAKKCGVKVRIAHSHTYSNNNGRSIKRILYENYMKFLIYKRATHSLACSNEAANDLFFKGNKRLEIINNGINLERFITKKYSKVEYRKKLNLPQNSFIIGHIGGFRPEKNHRKLIEIFQYISMEKKNCHLVLVGDGKERIETEKLTANLKIKDRVHFLGVREDTEDILKAFDVFVFPSYFEGLGIAVIEAQVSGLYCVVSDTLPKAVDITGNISFISLDADLVEWKNAILYKHRNNVEVSRLKEFDIRYVCERIYNIYNVNKK